MILYIMRHGETDYNIRHLFQGQIDIPLNATGLKQAEAARERFRNIGIEYDRIFCSPLQRARKTLEIVTGEPQESFTLDERVMEMEFGPLNHTPFDINAPGVGCLFTDPENYEPLEGAESFEEALYRTDAFYTELAAKHPGEKILVGTHGAIMKVLTVWTGNNPLSNVWEQLFGNCAIMEVTVDDAVFAKEYRKEDIPAPDPKDRCSAAYRERYRYLRGRGGKLGFTVTNLYDTQEIIMPGK